MGDSNRKTATEHNTDVPILARVVTEVFNPPWVAIAVLGAVAAHSTDGIGQFLQWWVLSAFFTSLLPVSFLIQALRRGSVSDWYVTQANQRMLPFTVAAISFGVAAGLMIAFSAPRELLAVTLAGMAGLFVALALTPRWKLSMHAGSITGAFVVLALVFGPWALVSTPAIPLVGWARIRIAHHTLAQVVFGGIIGGVVAAIVFLSVIGVT